MLMTMLMLGLTAFGMKSERVYCISEDRVATRLLFFFEAANPSGQALASLYVGPKMTQQKIRWEHTADDHLIGKKGNGQNLFDLHFDSFGAEGSGTVYLPTTTVNVMCTKL